MVFNYRFYNRNNLEYLGRGVFETQEFNYENDYLKSEEIDFPYTILENNYNLYNGAFVVVSLADGPREKQIFFGNVKQTYDSYFSVVNFVNFLEFNYKVADISIFDNFIIEDYIAEIITNQYINNEDSYMNIIGLNLDVSTSTSGKFIIDSEIDFLNFLDVKYEALKNYNIVIEATFDENTKEITLNIFNNENETIEISFNNYDVRNEITYTKGTSPNKCKVYDEATGDLLETYYLLSNGSVGTDSSSSLRIIPSIEILITSTTEEMEEKALQSLIPSKLDYEIKFQVKSSSQLYDVQKIKIGQKVSLFLHNQKLETIITSISYENTNLWITYTCGIQRATLTNYLTSLGIDKNTINSIAIRKKINQLVERIEVLENSTSSTTKEREE